VRGGTRTGRGRGGGGGGGGVGDGRRHEQQRVDEAGAARRRRTCWRTWLALLRLIAARCAALPATYNQLM